jgi:hypothetical protein
MAGRLGDILIDKGHVTQEQLESALRSQGVERGMLGAILLRRGQITASFAVRGRRSGTCQTITGNLHVSQKLLHVEQLELQPTGSNRKVVTLDLVVFGLTRKSQPL